MGTNLHKHRLVSLGKLFMNRITHSSARNSANSSTGLICGRRAVHMSVYDKNPEEYQSSIPDQIVEMKSDKYWTPHPQTGIFGPATDHIIHDEHDSHFSGNVDSVLEQKTFFRDIEDLEKPTYP
ncbi:unnamed protein product [Withania somnifera]